MGSYGLDPPSCPNCPWITYTQDWPVIVVDLALVSSWKITIHPSLSSSSMCLVYYMSYTSVYVSWLWVVRWVQSRCHSCWWCIPDSQKLFRRPWEVRTVLPTKKNCKIEMIQRSNSLFWWCLLGGVCLLLWSFKECDPNFITTRWQSRGPFYKTNKMTCRPRQCSLVSLQTPNVTRVSFGVNTTLSILWILDLTYASLSTYRQHQNLGDP